MKTLNIQFSHILIEIKNLTCNGWGKMKDHRACVFLGWSTFLKGYGIVELRFDDIYSCIIPLSKFKSSALEDNLFIIKQGMQLLKKDFFIYG